MVDTLQLAEDFELGGLTPEGAKRVARSVAESIEKSFVTRAHFDAAMADMKAEFKEDIAAVRAEMTELRAELKGDIAAVRAEMADLRTELKGDIGVVRSEIAALRAEMKADKLDLVKWMVGLNMATIGILFALLRFTG